MKRIDKLKELDVVYRYLVSERVAKQREVQKAQDELAKLTDDVVAAYDEIERNARPVELDWEGLRLYVATRWWKEPNAEIMNDPYWAKKPVGKPHVTNAEVQEGGNCNLIWLDKKGKVVSRKRNKMTGAIPVHLVTFIGDDDEVEE